MIMASVTGITRLMMMNTRLYKMVLRSSKPKVLLVRKNLKLSKPAQSLWNRLYRNPWPGDSLKLLNAIIRPNIGR